MAYQSFPWQPGDSQSLQKLVSLYLPDLKGKKVLDAGCNAGFFCGWAEFSQAKYVLGVDINPDYLKEAKKWFPRCRFHCGSWDSFVDTGFDVVLLLSALHYAQDQQQSLDSLMRRLDTEGVLVLELGIAPGADDVFVTVQRQIDTRQFPTWAKLRSMLRNYTYKIIGPSVDQAGDPVPRYVVHVRHKKPVGILLLGNAYSGKSFLSKTIFREGLPVISGDILLMELSKGEKPAPAALGDFLQGKPLDNLASLMLGLCHAGLLRCYTDVILQVADHKDFVFEGFVPENFHREFMENLHDRGIYVVDVAVYSAMRNPLALPVPSEETLVEFVEFLKAKFGFDEEAYLAANPDVAEAVVNKTVRSGFAHYVYLGRRENRKLR